VGDLNLCKVTLHLKLFKVTPYRVQERVTMGYKYTRTQGRIKPGNGGMSPAPPPTLGAPP